MSKNNMETAIRETYKCILIWQKRQEALMYALGGIDSRFDNGAHLRTSAEPLWNHLMQKEIDGWRKLFMWAMADEKWAEEARKLARERFLKEGSEIMHYLNPSRELPGSYFSEDYDAWRAEIDRAFPARTKEEKKDGNASDS